MRALYSSTFFTGLLAGALFVGIGGLAYASNQTEGEQARPCLNYWQRGDATHCDEPVKTPVAPPAKRVTPTLVGPSAPQAAGASPTTMDGKIDKFLDNYGKPPREFVAFYLDPTPENAMKWVNTYQQILTRPQQLAYVWTQAETLYANALKTGAPASTYTSTTFVPVKDFGISVPGFSSPILNATPFKPSMPPAPGMPGSGPAQTPAAGSIGGASILGPGVPSTMAGAASAMTNSLGGLSMASLAGAAPGAAPSPFGNPLAGASNPLMAPLPLTTPNSGANPFSVGAAAPSQQAPGAAQDLDISYYFSATCPYCKRLTPELSQLMSGLMSAAPKHIKMTCVDVTPYMGPPEAGQPYVGPQEANIKGKMPCTWRTSTSTEEDQLGINQTPTLIVRRGGASGMPEKVSGYVEPDRLKAFLLNGTPVQ